MFIEPGHPYDRRREGAEVNQNVTTQAQFRSFAPPPRLWGQLGDKYFHPLGG